MRRCKTILLHNKSCSIWKKTCSIQFCSICNSIVLFYIVLLHREQDYHVSHLLHLVPCTPYTPCTPCIPHTPCTLQSCSIISLALYSLVPYGTRLPCGHILFTLQIVHLEHLAQLYTLYLVQSCSIQPCSSSIQSCSIWNKTTMSSHLVHLVSCTLCTPSTLVHLVPCIVLLHNNSCSIWSCSIWSKTTMWSRDMNSTHIKHSFDCNHMYVQLRSFVH